MLRENFKIFTVLLLCLQISSSYQRGKIIKSYDEIQMENAIKSPASLNSLMESIFSNLTQKETKNDGLITNLKYVSAEDSIDISPWNGGTVQTWKMGKNAQWALGAYEEYLRNDASKYTYSQIDILPDIPAPYCPKEDYIYCEANYQYRSFNGSCNNLLYPWWGMAQTVYKRLSKPAYDDGYSSPRARSVTGNKLTNPRKIALKVHKELETESEWTNLLLFFGQYVAHDLTLIASSTYNNGNPKKCTCYSEDPDCLSFSIPKDDYVNNDQRCLTLLRSSPAMDFFNCKLGPRQQVNLATHWLDASVLYGSNKKAADKIRTFEYGLLEVSYNKYSNLEQLPLIPGTQCPYAQRSKKCLKTAEPRAEDNTMLLSVHALWTREHNRIARELYRLNPKWDDETLFQEARRIVTAEYQHIVYSEYLPIYLGEKVSKEFGLLPLLEGYLYEYDSYLFANIMIEFSGAAYRSSHTLVNDKNNRADSNYNKYEEKDIGFYQFNSKLALLAPLEDCLYGMLVDSSYERTPQMNPQMNNYLFSSIFKDLEMKRTSLPFLNIARGRELGIQGYNNYRKKCGLKYAYTFRDLEKEIPAPIINRLASVYESPDDIDLWTGIVSEKALKNAIIGPTGACIVAKQFSDLKYGDRFFYENGEDKNTRFTLKQLKEIRQASMARLICDNTNVNYIQKFPFLMPQYNSYVDCENLPQVNLEPWIDYSY